MTIGRLSRCEDQFEGPVGRLPCCARCGFSGVRLLIVVIGAVDAVDVGRRCRSDGVARVCTACLPRCGEPGEAVYRVTRCTPRVLAAHSASTAPPGFVHLSSTSHPHARRGATGRGYPQGFPHLWSHRCTSGTRSRRRIDQAPALSTDVDDDVDNRLEQRPEWRAGRPPQTCDLHRIRRGSRRVVERRRRPIGG